MSKKAKGALGMQWLTTGISTTLVLILLGTVTFFILFAQRLSDSVKENLTVTILLNGDAEEADINRMQSVLRAEPYVYSLTYVSKEQALQEQVEATGADPSEFLGANPFTACLELRMNAAYANSDSLAWIVPALKSDNLADDVLYQKELIDTVNVNLRHISYVLLILAALLALVSAALISNTVKLSVFAGRFVIRTMKLAGAGYGFIRRPFMVRSFWLGLLSGLAADAVLALSVRFLLEYDPTTAPFVCPKMLLASGGAALGFGLLLTLGCTYLSVGKYLRMKAGDLY